MGPVDVGTDMGRARGIGDFDEALNGLAISKRFGTVVEEQPGYLPPPLDGIFARYPYLHNGSVPTLCDLLSPPEARPVTFVQGPSEAPEDYDADCVGYPVGDAIPEGWSAIPDGLYDTTQPGRSNAGHDAMLRDAMGQWVLTPEDQADLIAFLKTL